VLVGEDVKVGVGVSVGVVVAVGKDVAGVVNVGIEVAVAITATTVLWAVGTSVEVQPPVIVTLNRAKIAKTRVEDVWLIV
jgi:hypothetical protein